MNELLEPQPPPQKSVDSIEVWPSLIRRYDSQLPVKLAVLMRIRNEQGICKYGEDRADTDTASRGISLARSLFWRLEQRGTR